MKRILLIAALFISGAAAYAQKPALGHDVYDGWERVTGVKLTPDGTILSYTVAKQEGDNRLFIMRTLDGKTLEIPRGSSLKVSPAADWAFCLVKPEFAATRAAKIAKKKGDQMPGDSLAIINLKTFEIKKISKVSSFKTGFDKFPYIAFRKDKATVIMEPATGWSDTLKNVSSYEFSRDGAHLALITNKDKKDSLSCNQVAIYDFAEHTLRSLDKGKKYYSSIKFNDRGDALVFLSSDSTRTSSDILCSIMLSRGGAPAQELVSSAYCNGEMAFTNKAAPYFSASGARVFAGLSEVHPYVKDTVPEFEKASLDIWNWDALITPPMKKANKARYEKYTNPAVIDVENGSVKQLGVEMWENISYFDAGDGDIALCVDKTPYRLSSYWDSNPYADAYIVSLTDGSRREILHKVAGTPQLSPGGKYACWYDCEDLQWYTYDLATDEIVCLTADCRTNFFDEEDDHPHYPAPYTYSPVWTKDDAFVLICDRYDVWKFAADGSSIQCLTGGEGRRNNVQFRVTDLVNRNFTPEQTRLGATYVAEPESPIYFSVYNEKSKENGLACMKNLKKGVPVWFEDKWSPGVVTKAADAAVLAFLKGNFRNPSDLYLSSAKATKKGYPALFKDPVDKVYRDARKLTSINPQQDSYRWGDVQLVHWTAYDGSALDGLLYVPEDIPEGAKVPLMIYFYERRSETLYSYIAPAPSRSTVNIPFYVSNGYAVFVPDIVFKPGHPGESAFNCICSGAEAMCEQFSFIDKDKMAIQGQSWGGYQVAYLVTRTDMFKAAEAGAPVGNMTSAYGGIRWESGIARAMQYEHGQSRIGKSMWEEGGLDLYIENSPVFFVDRVKTPVLIMHNDADGAVPWYQGIEFFSNLRRFGKPAWLLEYNNEAHNLRERRNCKDLSVRMKEFFDHYLMDGPLPEWMK